MLEAYQGGCLTRITGSPYGFVGPSVLPGRTLNGWLPEYFRFYLTCDCVTDEI
jgi:hypothetical protein